MNVSRGAAWPIRLAVLAVMALIALASAWSVLPPGSQPANAPRGTISGERGMQDLRMVAARAHPGGSAAQHVVRDYLVAQTRALGLPIHIQRATVGGEKVENIVVRIPGTGHTGRDVLITAHYDSTPAGPGAADDGVQVVAMVEALRALKAGDPLRNDLVFLFSDGEERAGPRGGLGIQAFMNQHPLARRLAVAFSFEATPDSSGTTIRATTPGDAWLMGQLRHASLPVFANSAINTSDRARPGNDFAAFPPTKLVGAEFLDEGAQVRYHNPGDNVAAADPGVVQDNGETMLALARHFGNIDLGQAQRARTDHVFFTAPLLGLVHYPTWGTQALAVAAAIAFAVVLVAARRRHGLRFGRTALGSLTALGTCVVLTIPAWAVWQLLLKMNPESQHTIHYPDFAHSDAAMAVITGLAVIAYAALAHWLAKRLGTLEYVAGGALLAILAGLLLAFAVPLFSPFAVWMAVGASVSFIVCVFLDVRRWGAAALLALASVPVLVLVIPLMVLEAINVENGPTVAVPVLGLVVGALLAQVLLITGRLPAPAGQGRVPAQSRRHAVSEAPVTSGR